MFTRPIFIIKRDYIKEKLHPLMCISKTLKVKKKKKTRRKKEETRSNKNKPIYEGYWTEITNYGNLSLLLQEISTSFPKCDYKIPRLSVG